MKPEWLNPTVHVPYYYQPIQEGHLGGTDSLGDASTWFPELWDWLIREFDLDSALDVGCGVGHATKFFLDNGLDAMGVDGAKACQQFFRGPQNRFTLHDFEHGPALFQHKYELVWSCEFLEHVEERFVGNLLDTFIKNAGKVLVFTASPSSHNGYHHVNAQSTSYWIEKFEAAGVKYDQELTQKCRELAPVGVYDRATPYFIDTGMAFRVLA